MIKLLNDKNREDFNKVAVHPLQSWPWGEFREKLGQKIIRLGKFQNGKLTEGIQISIHQIPHTPWTIGYCPRGIILDKEWIETIKSEVNKYNCIFVKFEPGVLIQNSEFRIQNYKRLGLRPGKSLFTPFSFQLELTKSETELLAEMKPKTRYNIKLAQKKGVVIEEDNSNGAFEEFQKLTEETTSRQHFFAHNRIYRQLMWETMRDAGIAHLLVARYHPSSRRAEPLGGAIIHHPLILTTWIIFIFNKIAYYPYGASSSQNRELMASNLLAWEALKLAKKSGCKMFDFWGSLGPEPDPKDPWYGFHRFKEGYGGKL
ncbi:peptidoglycan bridge formation glycyltransferase FemA/FemB family protein, partial [Candidatus Collierbacteria bacterium]|nr:peptidoglycan bridge formation glycyltransferase FemA/FemB family protein [Candidatus Collierbacteria bacterium]